MPSELSLTEQITPELRDGFEVHLAALRRGLDVTLYPRQVMMATPPGGGVELSFVHGVPAASTLAAVTYAQDKRMRRELLARAGIPVPEGEVFAIGRERERAREFAREIGYPVVVKAVVGDNLGKVASGLRDERQLDAAIDYLRTPERERPGFTRAAYALTLLMEPAEEDGREVSPTRYPFLVERHVSGEYVRLLVQDGHVRSAVHCPDGPTGTAGRNRDITGEIDSSIRALAVDAAATLPGLAVAAVDVVLTDHRRPAGDQQLWVVEFSERPWLAVQAGVSEDLSHRLGDEILTAHAAVFDVQLPAPQPDVSVAFNVLGATSAKNAAAAITDAAQEAGLAAQVDATDQVEGTVAGTMDGPADQVAWIVELLGAGRLHGQRAMLIDTNPR